MLNTDDLFAADINISIFAADTDDDLLSNIICEIDKSRLKRDHGNTV